MASERQRPPETPAPGERSAYLPTRVTLLSRLRDWDDRASWQDFFETYWKLIYCTARRSGLGDAEAQDVVQEVMVGVAKSLPAFRYDPSIGSFKGWLVCITKRKIQDVIHRSHQHLTGLSVGPKSGRVAFVVTSEGADPTGVVCLTLGKPGLESWDEDTELRLGAFSPDERWLAISKWREDSSRPAGHGRDIWLLPRGGGARVRITDHDGFDGHPAWSPDGRSLIYVSESAHPEGSAMNAWAVPVDPGSGCPAGVPMELTFYKDTHVRHLEVLAENGEIIFGLASESNLIFHADGGDTANAVQLAEGRNAVLSADGQWVYYVDQDLRRSGIYRSRTDGAGPPERLTDRTPLGFDLAAESLAIATRSENGAKMETLDLSDGARHVLTEITGTPGTTPRWSPDRQRIAYADRGHLNVIERDGSGKRRLGSILWWEPETIRWAPGGTMLAGLGYGLAPEGNKVFSVFCASLETGVIHNVTSWQEKAYKEGLAWHPDGEWLTYLDYATDTDSELRIAYPDGPDGRPTMLLVNQLRHWDYIGVWHPDGRRFHFVSNSTADEETAHILDHATGEIRHGGPPLPQWDRAGRHMIWSRPKEMNQLWIADLP